MTLPGRAVGAGTAFTVGENELFPPGLRFFSVGTGAFAGALELTDGTVVSAGFSFVLLHAVRVPMPTSAAAPAVSAIWRVKRADNI
jgi:hypothetical protein